MTKHTSTRRSLLVSVIALVCCFAMLLGTTFAWFTDSVSSEGNTIQSGTLKVDLLHKDDDQWISLKNQPTHKIFDYAHWEPGYTRVETLKVENLGTLALQYKLALSIAPGSEKTGPNGENLADVIQVYYTNTDATPANFAEIKDTWTDAGTLSDVMNSPATFIGGQLTPEGELLPDGKQGDEQLLTIALHMDENAGNEYQNLSVGNIYVNLVATQWTYEEDSFDENYDKDATFPGEFSASASVSVDDNGEVDQATTVGEQDGIHADIPTGVKMANGATELTLDIKPMGGSQANITLDNGETKKSYDIHIDGMSEDNTVPVQITLPGFMKKGLNTTSVELYHVENGQTVAMTLVDNPVNHNEFSYDPTTGTVVISTATFSEYTVVTDNWNLWEGEFDYTWYDGESSPYTISSADQLAAFGKIVDGTAEGIAADDFAGKIVYLGANIDLAGTDENGNIISFNPIGCGYADSSINSNNVQGAPFKGTFDGQNHTISNLYQNGWDLGLSYCNLGGGLFASIAGGTVKNLTITGANIVMECVEQGILVGLSQGDCTYENIKIYNSKVANYQRATGGLIGEVSPLNGTGITTIKDVTIGSDVVVGSLWGDFDAPVGGVIGARWDDDNTTKVVMENVTVAARLDVYNDVTSTYQWYAYRRAGMLIGNTDMSTTVDGRTVAAAGFLTCKNVVVKYGDWVNYHYCEFNNHNSSWPFVRVEAGENCSAFSNPRWGVPNGVNGIKVTPDNHTAVGDAGIHQDGDDCMVLLAFNQLYGGGQGVYGETEHDGVSVQNFYYEIIYREGETIHYIEEIVDNTQAITYDQFYKMPGLTDNDYQWVNAGSTKAGSIPANNINDVTLYLDRADTFVARFLYQDGTLYKAIEFNNQTGELNDAEPDVPEVDGLVAVKWDDYTLKGASGDVSIKPVYKINDYVQLNPVDTDGDGVTNYYEVVGSNIPANNTDIIIPDNVNGIEITDIVTGAFADGGLRDVHVPHSVTYIGKNAFCQDSWTVYPMIQIIFDGTKAEWDNLTKDSGWDDNIGSGSTIVCLRESEIGYYKQNGSNGFIIGGRVKWEWQSGSYPAWFIERYPELASNAQ